MKPYIKILKEGEKYNYNINIDDLISTIVIDAITFNHIRHENMYNPREYSNLRLKLLSEIDILTHAGVQVDWDRNGAFIESFHFKCSNPQIDKTILINQ